MLVVGLACDCHLLQALEHVDKATAAMARLSTRPLQPAAATGTVARMLFTAMTAFPGWRVRARPGRKVAACTTGSLRYTLVLPDAHRLGWSLCRRTRCDVFWLQ